MRQGGILKDQPSWVHHDEEDDDDDNKMRRRLDDGSLQSRSVNAFQRRVRFVLIQVGSSVTVQKSAATLFIVIRIPVLGPGKSETLLA